MENRAKVYAQNKKTCHFSTTSLFSYQLWNSLFIFFCNATKLLLFNFGNYSFTRKTPGFTDFHNLVPYEVSYAMNCPT